MVPAGTFVDISSQLGNMQMKSAQIWLSTLVSYKTMLTFLFSLDTYTREIYFLSTVMLVSQLEQKELMAGSI